MAPRARESRARLSASPPPRHGGKGENHGRSFRYGTGGPARRPVAWRADSDRRRAKIPLQLLQKASLVIPTLVTAQVWCQKMIGEARDDLALAFSYADFGRSASQAGHGWEPHEPPLKHASSIRIGSPLCGPAARVGVRSAWQPQLASLLLPRFLSAGSNIPPISRSGGLRGFSG
eukprot:COSAG05_NODE_182_length_14772_cov_42.430655_6_plen_175_part_00